MPGTAPNAPKSDSGEHSHRRNRRRPNLRDDPNKRRTFQAPAGTMEAT